MLKMATVVRFFLNAYLDLKSKIIILFKSIKMYILFIYK